MIRFDPHSIDRETGETSIVDDNGNVIERVHISEVPRRLTDLRAEEAKAANITYRLASPYKRRNRRQERG